MSQVFLDLVVGLTPPGRKLRFRPESPMASRDRFALFALAWFADDDGAASVSKDDLATFMALDTVRARDAVRRLEEDGLVEVSVSVSGPSTYRLRRDVLEARQFDAVERERDSLFQLERFGARRRPLNSMLRCGVVTIDQLAREIEAFRKLPPEEVELGFHVYAEEALGSRDLGVVSGRQLLEAFDAWRAQGQSSGSASPARP